MYKILMIVTIAFVLMLAGACAAAGFLNHIPSGESITLFIVCVLLAGFGALEANTMEDY